MPHTEFHTDISQGSKTPGSTANSGHSFVSSNDKYREYTSSAYAFLAVGALVLLILILSSAGVLSLPFTFSGQPVMFLALLFLAFVFLIIGLFSLKKAGAFKEQMKAENSLEKEILEWFSKAHTKEQLDHAIEEKEGSLPQNEVLCLLRMDLIQNLLLEQYPTLEENHADALSETIYQKFFETL